MLYCHTERFENLRIWGVPLTELISICIVWLEYERFTIWIGHIKQMVNNKINIFTRKMENMWRVGQQ